MYFQPIQLILEVIGVDYAAIYCRLSKEDEDKIKEGDESESIQNQKMMLVDYALEQGFSVYDIYSDDDFKGFDHKRPEFNRMINDAKMKKFNIIICKTQSRFTRDMELVEKYIHGMFPLLGIRFIGVVDHVDTNVKGNKKTRQINGLVNEWYSEDLSENIKRVFRSKMEKGQFLGAFACYGYIKDPEDNHHLIIDEEAAAVVRKIFSLTIQGLGAKQICNLLFEEGIPTPTAYKQSQGYKYQQPNSSISTTFGLWGVTSIKRILRNRMYVGDMVQGREKKVSYKVNKSIVAPEDEWIIVPNCHEPIIEIETFELVQDLLKQRRCSVVSKENGKRIIHLLAGKLRCKDCGSIVTRINGAKNGKTYLYCKLYNRSRGKHCSKHSIILDDLIEILELKIKSIIDYYLMNEGNADELKNMMSLHSEINSKILKTKREYSQCENKINSINKAISMLYIDKVNDKIDEKEYLDLKQTLQEEKNTYQKRFELLTNQYEELQQKKEHTLNVDSLIHKYATFEELTHEIVNEFVDYIEIGEKDIKSDEQEIVIHWRF